MEKVAARVLPIYANPDDVVEIHWRLPQGEALIERHTVPPAATQQARMAPPTEPNERG